MPWPWFGAPRAWAQERRRASEAMGQVREKGWCSSSTVGEDALTVIATPLRDADQSPLVLACIGHSEALVRARVDREIGPRLAGIATSIQDTRGL